MSTAIRAAWRARFFLLPALAVSGCLLIDPPGALKSRPADGNGGTAGSDGMNTGGTDAASGASGKTGATAGNGGRVNGTSGDASIGDNAGAAGESSGASGGGATTAGAGGGSAGQNSGGMHAGGASSGGTSSGGTSAGGTSGAGTSGGGTSTGGSGGSNGGSGGMGSTAAPSPGCTVADGLATLTATGSSFTGGLSTSIKLTINGRDYIIDIPTNYNPQHPYRLIFSWYQTGGSATGNAIGQAPAFSGPHFDAESYAFYGLRREANAANDAAIFVAPQGVGTIPWDFTRDSVLFDDLLAAIRAKLCIDDKRVFSVGFSFGGMMSYGLSITRQTKLRAVVAMSAVNYNLPGQPTDTNAAPIAYFGTTGMNDTTCPWAGGKACVLQHAQDNGCTPSQEPPTTTNGSKTFLCYDFAGCAAGYPVKVCTFDGGHTPSIVDDGTLTTDDGLNAFIPPLAWKFLAQF